MFGELGESRLAGHGKIPVNFSLKRGSCFDRKMEAMKRSSCRELDGDEARKFFDAVLSAEAGPASSNRAHSEPAAVPGARRPAHSIWLEITLAGDAVQDALLVVPHADQLRVVRPFGGRRIDQPEIVESAGRNRSGEPDPCLTVAASIWPR